MRFDMSEMTKSILSCESVTKSYGEVTRKIKVLNELSFNLSEGETVAITGASGSGKSTLLHVLGGLETPDSGQVFFKGKSLCKLTETERGNLRNQGIGFVYQFHHLLHEFSAAENVMMPLLVRRVSKERAAESAGEILNKVGLFNRHDHLPSQLSGGERQRVAMARALVTQPHCVLADEPTGNLDRKTAVETLELMFELQSAMGISFVIVTHDQHLADRLDNSYQLVDGKLISYRTV